MIIDKFYIIGILIYFYLIDYNNVE